jgi:serine/threonine protein kinase
MLTQKIAYQIASGLAYLHKKNVIFCDLKSDNILVWSLDVKEHINIKLSDYGISRQSFHEGALGVEGTPGYQAPEIRPRIVYDEKVPARLTAAPQISLAKQKPWAFLKPAKPSWQHLGLLSSNSFPLPACFFLFYAQ